MSRDKSYGRSSSSASKKTVATRSERIALMIKRGVWGDRKKVTGLPKTRLV
jgi:small basic protein (TIGR04137 family)